MSVQGAIVDYRYLGVPKKINFELLPELAKLNVMIAMDPMDLVRLCMASPNLCKSNPGFFKDRIKRECKEYERAGIEINADNALDKWKDCIKSKHEFELYRPGYNILEKAVLNNDDLTFTRINPKKEDLFVQHGHKSIIKTAVTQGKLEIVRYIFEKYNIDSIEDPTIILSNDNIDVIDYIVNKLGLEKEDLISVSMLNMYFTDYSESLDILKYLHKTFDITDDITLNEEILEKFPEVQNIDKGERIGWLLEEMSSTDMYYNLTNAIKNSDIEVFIQRNPSKEDLLFSGLGDHITFTVLHTLLTKGSLEMVSYVLENYDIDRSDLDIGSILQIIEDVLVSNNDIETIDYIMKKFNVTIEDILQTEAVSILFGVYPNMQEYINLNKIKYLHSRYKIPRDYIIEKDIFKRVYLTEFTKDTDDIMKWLQDNIDDELYENMFVHEEDYL